MAEYIVRRQHYGDRQYQKGDVRTLSPLDAKSLLDMGVLIDPDDVDEEKAEAPTANKSAPAVKTKAK